MKNLREEIIRAAGGLKTVLLFTGDAGSALLLEIVKDMDLGAVFIDTGYHFQDSCDYIKNLGYPIEIIKNEDVSVLPEDGMKECCRQRKTGALQKYLDSNNADCLIVPFRDDEKDIGIEDSYVGGLSKIKIIRPLASLSEKDVWSKINENKLTFSNLYKKGYKFIDCKCCVTRFGRKSLDKSEQPDEVDRETVDKLKALGYM